MPASQFSADRRTCYRKLSHYKYQLMQDFRIPTQAYPTASVDTPYLCLAQNGKLTIKTGYAWDGPSGPTIDTSTFMRASLVHDALYQLMRLAHLDDITVRKYADDLLKHICLEDGMCRFRAWYVHRALRWFGAANARPVSSAPIPIICAPK